MKFEDKILSYLIYIYMLVLIIFPSKYSYKGMEIDAGTSLLAIVIIFYFLKVIISRSTRDRLVNGIRNSFSSYLDISIILWVIMMIISTIYATNKSSSIKESARFLSYLILYFIIKYDMNHKKVLDGIIKVYMLLSACVGLYGIYQYRMIKVDPTKILDKDGRIPSFLENPNNLGVFCILAIFPCILLIIKEKNKFYKLVYSFIALMLLTGIVLSGSRNAFIALALGCVLLILMYSYKFLFLFIPAGIVMMSIPRFSARVMQISDPTQNASRIKIWKIAFKLIKEHPVLGIGNGNFPFWYEKYSKSLNNSKDAVVENILHPHNAFLKAQCELGIVGMLAFVGINVFSLFEVRKFIKGCTDDFYNAFYSGFYISMIVFILINLIDNFYSSPKVIAFFWILIAVFQGLSKNVGNYNNYS